MTGAPRGCHGIVTDLGPRDEDAGNVTLPPVFFNGQESPCLVSVAEQRKVDARPVDPRFRPSGGSEGVTFPASSSPTHHSAFCCGEKVAL